MILPDRYRSSLVMPSSAWYRLVAVTLLPDLSGIPRVRPNNSQSVQHEQSIDLVNLSLDPIIENEGDYQSFGLGTSYIQRLLHTSALGYVSRLWLTFARKPSSMRV